LSFCHLCVTAGALPGSWNTKPCPCWAPMRFQKHLGSDFPALTSGNCGLQDVHWRSPPLVQLLASCLIPLSNTQKSTAFPSLCLSEIFWDQLLRFPTVRGNTERQVWDKRKGRFVSLCSVSVILFSFQVSLLSLKDS
jgi:hypothetical protein